MKMKNRFRNNLVSLWLVLILAFTLVGCTRNKQPVDPAATTASSAVSTGANVEASTQASTEASVEASTESDTGKEAGAEATTEASTTLDKDGTYTSKEDVAAYIHTYGQLPQNFITKKDAKKLGWPGGSLEEYAPGKCIGGDFFGNYEGLLPTKKGRKYYECDVDTLGKSKRGAKRIIYSNDGLVYYTEDHYESFELLYGEP